MAKKGMPAKAVVVGAGIVVVSILGLWWATKLQGSGQAAVASIASALLSIGSLSLVYEFAMRKEIQDELIELVGIEKSTARSRLRGIESYDDFSWPPVLREATRVRALLSNPEAWLNVAFSRLLESGTQRPIEVELLLPASTSPSLSALSEFHHMTVTEFRASITRAASNAEDAWRAKANLMDGSSLAIRTYDQLCVSGVIAIDKKLVLISYLPSGSRAAGIDNGLVTVFDKSQRAYPASWLEEHIDALSTTSSLTYENVRRSV